MTYPMLSSIKPKVLLATAVLCFHFSSGQNAQSVFRKADSLYGFREYAAAAAEYAEGMKLAENIPASVYRFAAGSNAMANRTDSAFNLINAMLKSARVMRYDFYQFENAVVYNSLRSDKRWKPTLEKIRLAAEKNSYVQEEHIYGRKDGVALTMIRILPKVKSNGKGIIYVISGSWISGYNGVEVSTNAAEQYLSRGYTVFAVIHGSAPRYAIPDAVSDLKRAVRFVRYNAAKFNIDPNRLGITGTSAGGHLSLTVATADERINSSAPDPVDRVSSRVQAVAVLFPPTDLLNWGAPGLNMVNAKEILTARGSWGMADFKVWNDKTRLYEPVTDTAARNKIGTEVSPVYHVSADDPPVFIVHGDADPTVPLQQSKSIVEKFSVAGVPHRFVVKPGGKHIAEQMNPEWQEFADWFDKYLK